MCKQRFNERSRCIFRLAESEQPQHHVKRVYASSEWGWVNYGLNTTGRVPRWHLSCINTPDNMMHVSECHRLCQTLRQVCPHPLIMACSSISLTICPSHTICHTLTPLHSGSLRLKHCRYVPLQSLYSTCLYVAHGNGF